MCRNIALSGGSSLFPGMADRMQTELEALAPEGAIFQVRSSMDGRYGTWVGGSIMGSIRAFENRKITRAEYDEFGPSIVAIKCF